MGQVKSYLSLGKYAALVVSASAVQKGFSNVCRAFAEGWSALHTSFSSTTNTSAMWYVKPADGWLSLLSSTLCSRKFVYWLVSSLSK